MDCLDRSWIGTSDWNYLLEFIDGHARTLALLAGQFDYRPSALPRTVERLKQSGDEAVVARELLSRPGAYEALSSDQKARLKILAKSMDLNLDFLSKSVPG